MPLPKKLADLIARAGWRRLTFAGCCLAMIALGAYYLAVGARVDPRGNWESEIAVFRGVVKVAMLGFALLALATPWLVGRQALATLAPSKILKAAPGERRWFWIGVTVCTIASGMLWSQRMEHSLWADELTSMRRLMVGRWKHNDEKGKLLQPTWADTCLEYQTPNNHLAYSLTARWLHETFGGINKTEFERPYFNAFVLRLPALIAGLASIALIGYLALRLHSLLAAWLAMSWATLHPWMLEFATSARGYAFGMLFIALASVAAVKIFRRGGGWRWWIVYGVSQMLAFCSIPTLVHGLVGLNLAVFGGLVFDREVDRSVRRGHLGAFFTVNIIAGIGAIAALYPRLEQLHKYLEGDQFSVMMRFGWLVDLLSNALTGQAYYTWAKEDHPWAFSSDHWPVVLAIIGALLALAFTISAIRGSRRGGLFGVLLVLSFIVPQVTVFFQGIAMHFYLFPWYTAWGLPLVIVFFSVGAAGLLSHARKISAKWGAPVGGAVLVLIIAIATHQPRTAYLNVSVEPMMESAASFRASPNPWADHDDVISCSLISANHGYDPWNHRIRDLEDLKTQIARADATGTPLYCDTSWIERIPHHYPELAALLLDEQYFEEVEHLYGLQPQNSRYVLRYIPGSLLRTKP